MNTILILSITIWIDHISFIVKDTVVCTQIRLYREEDITVIIDHNPSLSLHNHVIENSLTVECGSSTVFK